MIPFVTHDHVAEKEAFAAAARARNQRAVRYRKWAVEAYRAGKITDWLKYVEEANRNREAALSALSFARLEAAYNEVQVCS